MNRPTWRSRFSWMLPAMVFVVGVSPRAAAQASKPAQGVGHGGEAPWASDLRTDCTASLQDVEKIDARRYSDRFFLSWTGACKSGKLDGYGTLTIWKDSILSGSSFVSRMEMTAESGLRMNDGVLSVSLQPSDLKIEVAPKSETPVYAAVAIYRKRKTESDYRYRATILAIARYLQAALPSLGLSPNNSNVMACIKDEGDNEEPPQSPGGRFLHCEAGVALERYPQDPVNARRVRVLGGGSRDEFLFQVAAARLVRDSLTAVWTPELAARGETPGAAREPIPPASSVMPPGYLQAMPMAERVLADMKVADTVQTRARQYAAVSRLQEILYVLTSDHTYVRTSDNQVRSGLTPVEDSLNRGYLDAQNLKLLPRSALVPCLSALMNQYSDENAPFRTELMDRYFSPAWKRTFLTLEAQYHSREDHPAVANASPSARAVEWAAPQCAPVPPDQHRFAVAVNDWCRRFQAPEQTNPIAREQFQHEASQQAAAISRTVGLVQSWGGILSAITAYDRPVIAPGEDSSAADLVFLVDTLATMYRTLPPAVFKATVGSRSPIYAAAGRMQKSQRVVFSGRALQFDSWVAGREPPRCVAVFKIVLTDLRPGR